MTAKDVALQIESLVSGVPYTTANLANISALLYIQLKDVNWCGFYLAQGEKLVLGPFQGKPACIEIPFGKGVCGTAAAERKAVAVPDVGVFEGHIACDPDSASEIVIPLFKNGEVAAVLDIDSATKNRFSGKDVPFFEEIAKAIETHAGF